MTPCTCHPGSNCTSAASCETARRVEFGENEMPEYVTATDYADNPSDTTTNLVDVRVPIGTRLALQAQPTPTEHIKEPYTLAELNERIASNDYNAELLLQHAMLLLNAKPAEVSDAQIAAGMRELFAGPKPWPSWEVTLKRVYQAMFALRPQSESEPFGYFRSHLWGWTDCGPDDEGARALYERPQAVPMTDEQRREVFAAGYEAAEQDAAVCQLPPHGWHCTRKAGHEGPCAAVETNDAELVQRGMDRLRGITAPAGGEG